MKKSLLLMSALFFCGMTALAQEPLYKMKLTLQDGSKLAALTDEIDSMQLTTVKAAEVHVTERYKTSSSIGINIEAEASVTRVQAAIVAGSEKDPNINYTEYVQKHSVCDAKGSYTLAFDFLKPESIYTIYVLAYDENGLPTGLKSLTCSTGAVADDPFTVTTTHVGTTTLKYNVTAKDASVKYCTFATGYDYYQRWQLEEGTNGDVIKHFISMWSTFASWYGENWQTMMKYDRREGTYEGDGYHLMWDARQVVITFGMDDDGNLVTPIQVDSIHTNAPTPVDMDIPLTSSPTSGETSRSRLPRLPTPPISSPCSPPPTLTCTRPTQHCSAPFATRPTTSTRPTWPVPATRTSEKVCGSSACARMSIPTTTSSLSDWTRAHPLPAPSRPRSRCLEEVSKPIVCTTTKEEKQ